MHVGTFEDTASVTSIWKTKEGARRIKVVQDCTLQRAALSHDACHFICPWLFNLCTHKKTGRSGFAIGRTIMASDSFIVVHSSIV